MTRTIPIYTSRGDAEAFLVFPYLFNRAGEWIGFISSQRDVYSVIGYHVGILTNDPRIIRNTSSSAKPSLAPPQPPTPIRIDSAIPLPKMMSDLAPGIIDVLQDEPERLHTQDAGDLRQDMD